MSKSLSDDEMPDRPSPKTPYRFTGARLRICNAGIDMTFRIFAEYTKRRVEACCFWYGDAENDQLADLRAVVIPRQQNRSGWYNIDASAMASVSAATRSQGWVNLSQIHTHPGDWVGHSPYDDENANSRWALSLVFPNYGRKSLLPWPQSIGVHEFQNDYWHRLSNVDARQRIAVESRSQTVEMIDLR